VSYLIALHEIAHVVKPALPCTLENEAACWRWALAHSLIAPTARTRRRLFVRLLSYLDRALRVHPASVPPPGAPFWRVLWDLDPLAKLAHDRHLADLAVASAESRPA
jgi:hypothetical protein